MRMKKKTSQSFLFNGRIMLISKLILVGIFLISQLGAFAQDHKTITGNITGEDGVPIPGVTIIEKGTNTGTVSDVDGNFTLSVPVNATLIFCLWD